MATIVTRAGKGSPLTHVEVDANFTNLNNNKAELASPALTGNVTVDTNSATAALKVTQTGAGPAFLVEDSASTDTTPFIIDASGNVGIRTTSPEAVLDINGNAFVRGAGSEGGEIAFFNPDRTTTGMTIDISSVANVGRVFQTQNNSILQLGQLVGTGGVVTLHTAANERMRIDSSGNISAGSSTTNISFDVGGVINLPAATTEGRAIEIGNGRTGNGNSYIDFVGDATYTDYGLRIIRNNTGANANSVIAHRGLGGLILNALDNSFIYLQTNNTVRFVVGSAGQLGIGGANYGTSGQVLTSGGSGAAPSWDAIPPVFSEWYVEFGNASTTTTIASGKQYVIVACGAGGGGASYSTGSVNTNTKALGGNGGSAVVASGTTSSAVTLTITVGAGGSGRLAGNQSGGDGGNTTISGTGISITAAGGKGGFTSGTTAVASTPNGASSGGTVYEPGYWNIAAGGSGNVSFSGTSPFGGGGTTSGTTTSGMSGTNDAFNSRTIYQTMAAFNVMTSSTKNMLWPVFASNVISYTGTASFVDLISGGVAGDASSDTNGGAGAYGGGGGGNSDSSGASSGAGGSGWYIIWAQK